MAVHTKAETFEMQRVVVQTEEEEGMDHILEVETHESTTHMEDAELHKTKEVTLLNIEASRWRCHENQLEKGFISLTGNTKVIQ